MSKGEAQILGLFGLIGGLFGFSNGDTAQAAARGVAIGLVIAFGLMILVAFGKEDRR